MKFTAAFIISLIPTIFSSPLDIPVLSEYAKLYQLCVDGGDTSYVGVRYAGSTYKIFHFDECYPYSLSTQVLAEMAVFCKSATCYNNPNPNCTGGAVPPVPVPVAKGLTLINAADFVQIIGQGATCQHNGLSDL